MSKYLPTGECLVLAESEATLLPLLHRAVQDRVSNGDAIKIVQVNLDSPSLLSLEGHRINTVVSFNVLEHVENDAQALGLLYELLKQTPNPAGLKRRIITLVPAHSFLMGSIDRSFGHFRRYSPKCFKQIFKLIGFEGSVKFEYFNLAGVPGWFVANRILKKTSIGMGTVKFFERICPYVKGISDFIHLNLRLPLGQSLICIMEF